MRHLSLEHKKKLSDARKRTGTPWLIGRKHSESSKEKMRQRAKKRGVTKEQIANLRPTPRGSKHPEETIRKMREAQKGSKNPAWKGGITKEAHKLRTSKEYRLWREAVLERDNNQCIWCNSKEQHLHADHIKPFAIFPELRFAIDNGRTLCPPCHRTTYKQSYGKK